MPKRDLKMRNSGPNHDESTENTLLKATSSAEISTMDTDSGTKCDSHIAKTPNFISKTDTVESHRESCAGATPSDLKITQRNASESTNDASKFRFIFRDQVLDEDDTRIVTVTPDLSPIEKRLAEHQQPLFIRHRTYHSGRGISAILSTPSAKTTNISKGVLLLHGHCGHKNYINLPIVDDLLHKQGYNVLRVDFRGLGNSEHNADESKGRTLDQDIQDIETCYLFFRDVLKVKLDTIIAHSRGVIAMFQFHLFLQHKFDDFIPNLINCSGRYDNEGLRTKILLKCPNWEVEKGYYANTLRFGRIESIFIPLEESLSVIRVDSGSFGNIDPRCSVLSIYGSKDDIVPLSAATNYDTLLQPRHKLVLIDDADHNFYGVTENSMNNPLSLPLKRGKINYNYLVAEAIREYLCPGNVSG